MKYRVLQNGKPCSEYGIKGWDVDTFDTKREAEVFAFLWAYPFDRETAEVNAPTIPIGVDKDYSMSEFPVMMRVEELT